MYAKLEDRLAKVAGLHSGVERAIFEDQGATAATHMHEMIHDKIFYETADGLFHLLVYRISKDAQSIRIRVANKALLKILLNETRLPHEAAATYMGIEYLRIDLTSLRSESSSETNLSAIEYNRLPPEYKGYHKVLASLLDPYVSAPWLRLALAWAITHWAFSSPRLSEATRLVAGRAIAFDDLPGPGSRLASAIQAISNFGVAEQGVAWVNIDEAAEWPGAAGAKKAEVTQTATFDAVRAWLDKRVASSRWPRQVSETVRELMARHDFEFEERPDTLPYQVEDALIDGRAQVRIAERARVYRHSTAPLQGFDLDALSAFARSHGAGPLSLTILANFRWGRKKYRAVLRKGPDGAMPAMALNATELGTLLRWFSQKRATQAAHPPIIVCDLTLTTDALSAVTPRLFKTGFVLRKCEAPFNASKDSASVIPVNYIEHTLPAIMEHVPGTIYNLDVQTDGDGARIGVMLFVPEDANVHACMKIVPRYDLGGYLVFQKALQGRSGLTIGSAGADGFSESYAHMIRAMMDYWEPL